MDAPSDPDPVLAAFEEVKLGASLAEIHRGLLMRALRVRREEELSGALRALATTRRQEIREEVSRHMGRLCRLLGERHGRETRMARVLEDWVRESGEYEAFDALLCNFDFPARSRLLEQGRRRFPSTLTAHWPERL